MRPTPVISGQWEPGLVLHACPITEEERSLLGLVGKQNISVINPEDEGGSAGVVGNPDPTDNNEELPEEEIDSIEAREFIEKLCEKTASEWAEAQMKDESARIGIEFLHSGVPVGEITEETIPDTVKISEIKWLVFTRGAKRTFRYTQTFSETFNTGTCPS